MRVFVRSGSAHIGLCGCLEFNGDMVAIGGNQPIPSLEADNVRNFRIRELQGVLNAHGLIILQVQDDFGFGVIDDSLTVLATIQGEEIGQVLSCADGAAAITPPPYCCWSCRSAARPHPGR